MAHDAPSTPGVSPQSKISIVFGLIADATEWEYPTYQALITRLLALRKSPLELTLGDVLAAHSATLSDAANAASDSSGEKH